MCDDSQRGDGVDGLQHLLVPVPVPVLVRARVRPAKVCRGEERRTSENQGLCSRPRLGSSLPGMAVLLVRHKQRVRIPSFPGRKLVGWSDQRRKDVVCMSLPYAHGKACEGLSVNPMQCCDDGVCPRYASLPHWRRTKCQRGLEVPIKMLSTSAVCKVTYCLPTSEGSGSSFYFYTGASQQLHRGRLPKVKRTTTQRRDWMQNTDTGGRKAPGLHCISFQEQGASRAAGRR